MRKVVGVGCVIKITKPYKKKDGTDVTYSYWLISKFPLKYVIRNGKVKMQYYKSPYFNTQEDALEERNRLIIEREKNANLSIYNPPVFKVVLNCVYHKYKMHEITSTTLGSKNKQGYLYLTNHYIKPMFDGVGVKDFNSVKFEEELIKLPKGVVNRVLSLVRQGMEFAKKQNYIEYNPVSSMKPPKNRDNLGRKPKGKQKGMSPHEANALIEWNYNKQKNIGIGIKLGFLTGLRANELRGIELRKIDFAKHKITIDMTYGDLGKGKEGIKGCKNDASYRDVPYPPLLDEDLRWCIQHSRGGKWLMENTNGNKPISQCNFYHRCFHHAAAELGIKRAIDTRVMRHFYVTYMLEVDVDKFDVKTAVGHTTFEMIDRVYREVTEDTNNRLREGASKLLDLIYPKKEKSNIIQFPTMA